MKAEIKFAAKCIVVGAAIAAASLFLRSAPKAQPTLALPFATVTTGVTTSTQIVGANPTRRAIQICNAGTGNVFALPAGSGTPANNNGLPIATLTCFTQPTVTASGTSGGGGAAWNAFATASTNILVLEW
jgi:hypothetical protein